MKPARLGFNGHKWVPVPVTQTGRLYVPSGGRQPQAWPAQPDGGRAAGVAPTGLPASPS
jgi:hypothetical protein